MDYKYKELDYAKEIYENGILSEQHIYAEIRLVAIYMRRILGLKPKLLKEKIYEWCALNINGYNKAKYFKIINKAVSASCKTGSCLINISEINIYDYELDYIISVPVTDSNGLLPQYEYECRKLMFTFLVKMKINRHITQLKINNNEFIYKGIYFKGGQRKYNELKKAAKIPTKIKINEDLIRPLISSNQITAMYNGLIKLKFMEILNEPKNAENLKIILKIKNFNSIGLYFDYINKIPKIKICGICGSPFKQKSNNQCYCSEECAKKYRKQYNSNKQKAYRLLKQSVQSDIPPNP